MAATSSGPMLIRVVGKGDFTMATKIGLCRRRAGRVSDGARAGKAAEEQVICLRLPVGGGC